jgi:hypothetical protein
MTNDKVEVSKNLKYIIFVKNWSFLFRNQLLTSNFHGRHLCYFLFIICHLSFPAILSTNTETISPPSPLSAGRGRG